MERVSSLGVVVTVVSASGIACPHSPAANELWSEVAQVGDTAVVTTHGEADPLRVHSVQVIWRSPELENPRALLAVGGRLIVGDPTRLHILTETGEHVRTVGRAGGGPGEFGSLAAVGRLGSDTVAVHDVRHQRISFFTPEGDYLGSAQVTPAVPYVNPVNGSSLVPLRGGVLSLWRENIRPDRSTRTGLIWRDLEADTVAVLGEWDGVRWIRLADYAAPAELFGPRVIAALAADRRIAVGHGVDYCFIIRSLVESTFRKACRDRAPVPVGEGVRRPDLSRVESRRRQVLTAISKEQAVADHLPHFDRMLFDSEGWLWVRTLGPELADFHPYLRDEMPERQPAYRTWDIFDEEGRFVAAAEVPSNFEPHAINSRRIYGFVELATGEIAIGAAAVPLPPVRAVAGGNGV